MQVLYPRCAGLDVHKDVVVACVRCVSTPVHQEVRSFHTTTSGLLSLADWLNSHACTHVAMEATGVYWKPVWHILEEDFELVLANAAHIKNVPGRKTDVNDATWIADLLAHGLIRSSFVPPYDEVVERDWSPLTVVDAHAHPFAANTLVVRGEMWLAVGDGSIWLSVVAAIPHASRSPFGVTLIPVRIRCS
jgi:hypothetical protein